MIKGDTLHIRQQFPGLEIRFTRNGKTPTLSDEKYSTPVNIQSTDQIVVRVFDPNGRGGNSLKID
jgi:hypothetical protein